MATKAWRRARTPARNDGSVAGRIQTDFPAVKASPSLRTTLDETADSNGNSDFLELRQVQSEAQQRIHRNRSVRQIGLRMVERSHAIIANELQPARVIQEPENERRIVG